MKTITLKFGKERIADVDTFFSTLSLLKAALNNIPQGSGISVTDMSNRLKILEILNSHPECDVEEGRFEERHLAITKDIQIEDADFETLKKLFVEIKWKVVAKFVVELSNELNSK
jgi:hypothetical protein